VIGEVLGSYRVVSRLGAGGMGTVWLGEHQLLGSKAAIKLLLPEMSEQKRIVERFFDEARAATRIQDPGIVVVHEIGWHGTSAYIVMEHLNGETLTSRLARYGNLPVVMALRLLNHCGLAMAAAHARGIVHRDLKPDNIFVVSDPAVPGGERTKILDFGIAKLIDDADKSHSRTQTGMIMGTPAYMSPEQCRGAGNVDHRTDIYALGCVMYAMLVGHPPFVAPTAGDLIASHLREEPAAPSSLRAEIPPSVDELVLRCLAKSPDARYQTMTELVRAGGMIIGENMSIATIPPLLARTSEETIATEPPQTIATPVAIVPTTLHGATGESHTTTRPWRGGLLVIALALAVIGTAAFIATRDRTKPAGAPAVDAAAPPSLDATTPIDAAPSVVIQPDAGSTTKPPRTGSGKRPPRGSAGSGSSFNPYNDF
jgi:serine/threonine-protein kinase